MAKMDDYTAVMICEGVEDADYDTTVEAWQHLHDTGLAYRLQGFFGRTAHDLVMRGIIGENRI